jgi:SLT domain-containing protein
MSTPAIDLQEIPISMDTLDATDAVDRNLQGSLGLAATVSSVLRAIAAPGANNYFMPIHVAAADRGAYETAINNGATAAIDLVAALQYVATLA